MDVVEEIKHVREMQQREAQKKPVPLKDLGFPEQSEDLVTALNENRRRSAHLVGGFVRQTYSGDEKYSSAAKWDSLTYSE